MKLINVYTPALLLFCPLLIPQVAQASEKSAAVVENNYAITVDGLWRDVDVYSFQVDGHFALSEKFGASLGANALLVDYFGEDDDLSNLRAAIFMRDAEIGRIEISYQHIFNSDIDDGFWGLTSEYYFDNWTLGAYVLTEDFSELNDLNLYTNIYFTDNVRLELDLLDASDSSVLKGTVKFQLPEIVGNEWQFNVSYGQGFYGESQIGLGVKYTPNFDSTLKSYYRKYSTNIKSAFFN